MISYIRKYFFVVLAVILFSLYIALGYNALKPSFKSKQVPVTNYITEVIDSVWYLSPGQLNTLQTDYIYYAKTESGFRFRTGRLMEVGDTINIPKK